MEKILLIIQREYLTRVRKKSFLIMSILGPILIASIYIIPIWLTTRGGDTKVIQVLDESNLFNNKFEETDKLKFTYVTGGLDKTKEDFKEHKFYDALLYIPPIEDLNNPKGFTIFSEQGISAVTESLIARKIESEIKNQKLEKSGIDKALLEQIETRISITTINILDDGERDSSTAASTGVGIVAGMLIYFFTFIYGAQVMRGVIEEKTSRIVEVIISSVKPFQLMIGKILGIAGVSLTQMLIWFVLSVGAISASTAIFQLSQDDIQNQLTSSPISGQGGQNATYESAGNELEDNKFLEGINTLKSTINFTLIISCFVFYFIFGYLMYASLFGAIGAAVDSETDTQQFMLPVTAPLIISIMLLGVIITEPNGSIAFWMSMIPFTSPVIMMIRLPFIGVGWELFLSMGLLVLGFLGATWVAARIYRIGILMYGKKVSFKELSKWLFYKF